MKAVPILLAGLLLVGTGAAAQEGSTDLLGDQRVTHLIRAALESPDAPESWAGLAQGLSSLGAEGVPGTSGLEAAVRIADSLAFSPLLARSDTPSQKVKQAGLVVFFKALVDRVAGLASPFMDPVQALSLLGLLMGGWIVLEKVWRLLAMGRRVEEFADLIRGVARVAKGRRVATQPPPSQEDPRELALALTEHGLPANEVARQTGLAQDELAVVLALRSRSGAFGRRGLKPRRRSA